MANEKEQVIFEFTIEEGNAFAELEKLKSALKSSREEQKKLDQAFKKGVITQKEWAAETVRLEAHIKRNQSTYNNLQKSVTGVKTQLDKLIDSNKKISASFAQSAEQINIAGVSLASFKNPATAAIAAAGGLFAMYQKSTRGAEDLKKAQDLLNASVTVFSNKAFTGQGGQFTANSIIKFLSENINPFLIPANILKKLFSEEIKQVDELAGAMKVLRDIDLLSLKDAQTAFKKNLREAELNARYAEDESKSLQARLDAANDIEGSVNAAESALLNVQKDRLAAAQKINELAAKSVESQALIKDIEREIADIQEDAEGKRSAAKDKILAIERLITAEQLKQATGGGKFQLIVPKEDQATALQEQEEFNKMIIDTTKAMGGVLIETHQQTEEEKAELTAFYAEQGLKDQLVIDRAKLQSASMLAAGIAGIFEEGSELQKVFAIASLAADTAEAIGGLTAASEQNPANAVSFGAAGILQYASGIARILGNIATAKSYLSQAGAGGDFLTKGPTMLMVGDNPGGVERVTVEPLSGKGQTKIYGPNLMAFGGGGSITSAGDGGLFVNSSTLPIDQMMMQKNMMKEMLKSMPPMEVSVVEINKVQNRVKVKQNVSKGK